MISVKDPVIWRKGSRTYFFLNKVHDVLKVQVVIVVDHAFADVSVQQVHRLKDRKHGKVREVKPNDSQGI